MKTFTLISGLACLHQAAAVCCRSNKCWKGKRYSLGKRRGGVEPWADHLVLQRLGRPATKELPTAPPTSPSR